MLSKVISSSIFKVFGMTRPGIEPRSPGPLANTLTAEGDILIRICLLHKKAENLMKITRSSTSTLNEDTEFSFKQRIDLFVLTACHHVKGYFMPIG